MIGEHECDSWQTVRPRRETPTKARSNRSRYERDGPLSPFRSPLRMEATSPRKTRTSPRKHARQDLRQQPSAQEKRGNRPLTPKKLMVNPPDNQCTNSNDLSALCWKVAQTEVSAKHVDEEDFPTLDNCLRLTPESGGKGKTRSSLSWSEMMDEHDEQKRRDRENRQRSKRRLQMAEGRENARSERHDRFRNGRSKESGGHRDTKPNSANSAYNTRRSAQNRPKQDRRPSVDEILSRPDRYETDNEILARRQKQIDYGKNTDGYKTYMNQIPRLTRTRHHPDTPDKYGKFSRRSWDTQIKIWRRKLHLFDQPGAAQSSSQDISDTNSEASQGVSSTAIEVLSTTDSDIQTTATPHNSQASDCTDNSDNPRDLMDEALFPMGDNLKDSANLSDNDEGLSLDDFPENDIIFQLA